MVSDPLSIARSRHPADPVTRSSTAKQRPLSLVFLQHPGYSDRTPRRSFFRREVHRELAYALLPRYRVEWACRYHSWRAYHDFTRRCNCSTCSSGDKSTCVNDRASHSVPAEDSGTLYSPGARMGHWNKWEHYHHRSSIRGRQR